MILRDQIRTMLKDTAGKRAEWTDEQLEAVLEQAVSGCSVIGTRLNGGMPMSEYRTCAKQLQARIAALDIPHAHSTIQDVLGALVATLLRRI